MLPHVLPHPKLLDDEFKVDKVINLQTKPAWLKLKIVAYIAWLNAITCTPHFRLEFYNLWVVVLLTEPVGDYKESQ